MIINATCIAIPAVLWIASVQVEYPDRLSIIWIAIFLGQFPPVNSGICSFLLIGCRPARGTSSSICQTVGGIKKFIMGSETPPMV